jgi:hypothetical protein
MADRQALQYSLDVTGPRTSDTVAAVFLGAIQSLISAVGQFGRRRRAV